MKLPTNRGDASTILLIVVMLIAFVFVGKYLSGLLPDWYGESTPTGEEGEDTDEADEPVTEDVSFTTILQGSTGGLEERGALVIKNETDWAKLKKALSSGILENKNIDFGNYIALAVFFGQKNTGGYTIRIDKIEDTDGITTVTIKEISPGSSCIVTQALTTPYHIVTIPKTDDQIKFVSVEDTVSCN